MGDDESEARREAVARARIAAAWGVLARHWTSPWTGCCDGCGRDGPCPEAGAAVATLRGYAVPLDFAAPMPAPSTCDEDAVTVPMYAALWGRWFGERHADA